MLFALETVVPIFAFVAIGWTLAVTRTIGPHAADGLAIVAGAVGIPMLIFRTIVFADFGAVSPWALWACYFPAAAISWAIGHLVTARVFDRDARTAVVGGMGAAFANTAFVGLPLAQKAYGDHGALIVTLIISVHMPIMMTAATLMMTRASGSDAPGGVFRTVWRILKALSTNPIVLGIFAGLAFRFFALKPTGVALKTVQSIAEMASPVALLSLGMSMHFRGIRGDVAPSLAISTLKLVAMPALVLATCRLVGLDAADTGPLVVVAGVPAGINVFMLASQFGAGQRLGAGVVALTTALGVLTSVGWLTLLGAR